MTISKNAVVALFLFILSTASLFAQTKKDTLQYQVQQVIISATRYPEQLFELPYSASVLKGRDLENTKSYGLDEVLTNVPGVLAQSRYGNQDVRIVIRGFGARGAGDKSNAGTSRGIRVMVDGIPETEPDGRTSYDLVDLSSAASVEVIRSNASALWGNAAGGVISISTVPEIIANFSSAEYIFGSYGYNKAVARAGVNFSSGKIVMSLSNSNYDGWRDHSSSTRTFFNLSAISNLSETTRLGVFLAATTNTFHVPGPLTQLQFDTNPKQANPDYAKQDERRYNRLGRIGVTLDAEIVRGNSVSAMAFVNPKYLQRSERNSFRDFTRYHIGGNFMFHNEMTLTSEIKSKLVIGVDEAYQDGAILFYNLSAVNGRGNTLSQNKSEGANTLGSFFQEELLFNEKLSLIVGGRYDKIKYGTEQYAPDASGIGLTEKTFRKFTPKAGVTYRLTPTFSLFASIGGGVEVPAGNEIDPAGTFGADKYFQINPIIEPIVSTTYEAGTKHLIEYSGNSFLQALNYEVAFYAISVKNDIVPYDNGGFYFTAGKTSRMGVEIGLDAYLNYGLTFQTAMTFSANKYIDYIVDSVYYTNPGKFADYKDNKVAGTPSTFYKASLKYAPEMAKSIFVSLSMNGIGQYYADAANKYSVPSFNILNLTFGMNRAYGLNEHLSIKGFLAVNNLTDKLYAASAFVNPKLTSDGVPVFLEAGLPRTFSLSVSLGWK